VGTETLDGLMLEYHVDHQFDVRGAGYASDDGGREQGVSSELEKIVARRYGSDPECVAPDVGHRALVE
jgi:hypothetical protein